MAKEIFVVVCLMMALSVTGALRLPTLIPPDCTSDPSWGKLWDPLGFGWIYALIFGQDGENRRNSCSCNLFFIFHGKAARYKIGGSSVVQVVICLRTVEVELEVDGEIETIIQPRINVSKHAVQQQKDAN
jgi:hypothetical protein